MLFNKILKKNVTFYLLYFLIYKFKIINDSKLNYLLFFNVLFKITFIKLKNRNNLFLWLLLSILLNNTSKNFLINEITNYYNYDYALVKTNYLNFSSKIILSFLTTNLFLFLPFIATNTNKLKLNIDSLLNNSFNNNFILCYNFLININSLSYILRILKYNPNNPNYHNDFLFSINLIVFYFSKLNHNMLLYNNINFKRYFMRYNFITIPFYIYNNFFINDNISNEHNIISINNLYDLILLDIFC